MDIVFAVFTIILLALATPAVCIAGYLRIRRKGYRPPGTTLVLLIAGTIGIAGAVAVSPKIPSNAGVILFMSAFFWLPLLVFAFLTFAAIWLLPRRNPRRFGIRRPRFPFAAAGKLLIGIGVGFSLLLIAIWARGTVNDEMLGKTFQVLFILLAMGAYFVYMGRRAKAAQSLEEVVKRDQRAPVLYLRPFNQEWQAFVVGPKSRYGQYVTGFQRFAMTLGRYEERMSSDPNVAVRFEEYLGGALTSEIGPFFALGNPEDYTLPEGAVRTYATDTDWKDYLERLAVRASCIVTEVGGSENLTWEFAHLRERGWQEKLFVITRPKGTKTNWFDRTYLWLKGVKWTSWSDFRATLTPLGYSLPEETANGTVLTFNAAGESITLTTGAHDPEQFVEPIRSYLIAKAGYSEESFAPPPPPAEVDTPRKKIVRLLLSDRVWLILVGIALVGPFLRSYIPGIRYLGNSGTMRKGIELYQRQQYTEALPYFQRAAEGGNTQAMTNLALIYEEGRGVPKDERKAVELYTKAINDSDNPDSQAMVNLGVMYLNGQGALPKDESKALELFKKAVEADNDNGMAMLGAMYEDGAGGLPKDMATALSWYKKSAKKGNEFAQKHLKELQGGTSPQSQ